jgi:hypothetical protein
MRADAAVGTVIRNQPPRLRLRLVMDPYDKPYGCNDRERMQRIANGITGRSKAVLRDTLLKTSRTSSGLCGRVMRLPDDAKDHLVRRSDPKTSSALTGPCGSG